MHKSPHTGVTTLGAILTFAMTGASGAAYIDFVAMTADDFEYGDYGATDLATLQFWIAGLDPGDSVLAVYGYQDEALRLVTSDTAGFYNAPDLGQGHLRAHPDLFPVSPELQWDTYLAIGESNDVDVTPGFPDVALAGGGSSIEAGENLAWFDADPSTPEYGIDGRVLLGQLSFGHDHSVTFPASLGVLIQKSTGEAVREYFLIPAPGAISLIAAAMVCARRRRK